MALYAGELWRYTVFKDKGVNYGIAPIPKAIYGSNKYSTNYLSNTYKSYVGFVPPKIDQNAKFVEALNMWHAPKSWTPSRKKQNEKLVCDKQSLDVLESMGKSLTFHYRIDMEELTEISSNMDLSNKTTPEKFAASIKSKLTSIIKKQFS